MNRIHIRARLIALCLAAIGVAVAFPPAVSAAIVDLTAETMYARTGFSPRWTTRLPDKTDKAWIAVPPSDNGMRPIQVKSLNLPDIPARTIFSLHDYKPEQFTFVTRFALDSSHLEKGKALGLLLAHISDNWEIYVNGVMLRSEMHIDGEGGIDRHKSSRHVLVHLDPRIIKAGENVLAFRVTGDPTFTDTGFLHTKPYVIDEYETLAAQISETIPIAFIVLYGFLGLYYLFLFSNRKGEAFNLYYGLFCVMLFIYLFMRTHTVESVLTDSNTIFRLELTSLFTLVPLIGLFFDDILERSISLFNVIYGGFCAFLILIVVFPTTQAFAVDVLRVWQITSIIPIAYYSVFRIGRKFFMNLGIMHKKSIRIGARYPRLDALRATMWHTIAGNLIIGVLVLASTTIFDIIDATLLNMDLVLTRYGFFMFVIGTALILSNKFIGLQVKNEKLNLSLKQKISDLDEANRSISISEEKYKVLVEGTNECIFTLDAGLKFQNANKAFLKFLHASPEEIRTYSLFDIVYDDPQDAGVTKKLMLEKLDSLTSEGVPASAKVLLKPLAGVEPQNFVLRLEGITIEGKNEFLGRASHVGEDALLNYFISERQKYEIGNFLITAEEISHRLVRNLARYLEPQDVKFMRIGLREMIINAIEHGNLNITFEEKTQATMEDNYIEFVMKRQQEPHLKDKKVRIEYLLSPEKAAYKISDDGNGFDYKIMMDKIHRKVNDEMLYHGRGITMALNIFDKITFNRKGNEVLLEKRLSSEKILESASETA
ncbi:MAG: hypothetical protein EPN93_02860 [Spirochaetes bacterium]|nr:MAG: hypothetical protein EPN93_02860 [Spirochaetota bacterium]